MVSFWLKRALPFTLSFIFGAVLSALAVLFGASGQKLEAPTVTRSYDVGGHCRMRRHNLVAESRPLNILFKPDVPFFLKRSVRVKVTFGADGEVQKVEQLQPLLPDDMLKAAERAARQITFTPETINSVPVTVTKDVEINFVAD